MLSAQSTAEEDVDSKRQSLRALTNLSLSCNFDPPLLRSRLLCANFLIKTIM